MKNKTLYGVFETDTGSFIESTTWERAKALYGATPEMFACLRIGAKGKLVQKHLCTHLDALRHETQATVNKLNLLRRTGGFEGSVFTEMYVGANSRWNSVAGV